MAAIQFLRHIVFRRCGISLNGSHITKIMTKKVVFLLIAAVAIVCGASGCRTVHGAGEDIENAGAKIQEKTPP